MTPILAAIAARSDAPLISGHGRSWSGTEFLRLVRATAQALRSAGVNRLALLADNSPGWLAVDLAARHAGIVTVPLPLFFTSSQFEHALDLTGVNGLVSDREALPGFTHASVLPCGLGLATRAGRLTELPGGTSKVSFTSGTTGQPKGVCLSPALLDEVAASLAEASAHVPLARHLCALPLPVLLENVAGAYSALLRGCELILPSLAELGWNGSSALEISRWVATIERHRAESLILLPQMLKGLVDWLEGSGRRLESLKFTAVGGARTAPGLIQRARAAGVPVHEGYGLSECGSVVCLNLPGADRPGSVGRALRHRQVRVSPEGELLVRCPGFLGYAGQKTRPGEWLATGDSGHIDDRGFVSIDGRRSHVLITAFGRNIAPEWVESELLAEAEIARAVVVGDSWPTLGALLVPAGAVDLAAAVRRCNARLPDYARIGPWVEIPPLHRGYGLLSANGKLRRGAIEEHFAAELTLLATRAE